MFYKLWIVFVFMGINPEKWKKLLSYENCVAKTKVLLSGDTFKENESKRPKEFVFVDNIAKGDEHHKIVILVPQHVLAAQKKKKPKHHHKVVPVVHTGKVIHAHHHHGKVDHLHGHSAKAKHNHRHFGSGNHKHSHFGAGMHTHKHLGKGSHDHKHNVHGSHKHAHSGKGSIHHIYSKHHKPPPKKYWDNFKTQDANVETDVLKIVHPPSAVASRNPIFGNENSADKIIQIRIPEENEDEDKEVNIGGQYDIPVFRNTYHIVDDDDKVADNVQYLHDIDELIDHDDINSDSEYQLGDGYKLAASAAARAAAEADETYNAEEETLPFEPVIPQFPIAKNNGYNGLAYSDTYRYQY